MSIFFKHFQKSENFNVDFNIQMSFNKNVT